MSKKDSKEKNTGRYVGYHDWREVEKEVDKPPLFKTWNAWYRLVLLTLVGLIIVFYIFTKIYE